MANTFGQIFKITTFGESHGKMMGVVIDGCPANIEISEEEVFEELKRRRPGFSHLVSSRKEEDRPQIVSGVFEGKTTGQPICILIENQDANSSAYASIKDVVRPGHADALYFKKYGHVDARGGGRASGRETVCRVAASAVAKKIIPEIQVVAYIKQMGSIEACMPENWIENVQKSTLFCPDPNAEIEMIQLIEKMREEGDSVGGIVEVKIFNVPAGLGEPIFDKLEANLAKAMLSIPGVKGFEIGSGFKCALMRGSEHNDLVESFDEILKTVTNHAGGVLGGISTGMPLEFRVAIKPTSSIQIPQQTVTYQNTPTTLELSEKSRHDPCIAVRAVPVIEAMSLDVLADHFLLNQFYFFSEKKHKTLKQNV